MTRQWPMNHGLTVGSCSGKTDCLFTPLYYSVVVGRDVGTNPRRFVPDRAEAEVV